MEILAFVLALAAVIAFVAHYLATKHWVSVGLALLTVAWICQLVIQSGSHVTIH